jgi:hypothetical protein
MKHITLSISDIQHNDTWAKALSVFKLSIVIQSEAFSYCYAECYYAACNYGECHYSLKTPTVFCKVLYALSKKIMMKYGLGTILRKYLRKGLRLTD